MGVGDGTILCQKLIYIVNSHQKICRSILSWFDACTDKNKKFSQNFESQPGFNPGVTRVGVLIFGRYNMDYKFVKFWIISIFSLKTHHWRRNEQLNENMACMSLHMVLEFDWRRNSLWEFSCFLTRVEITNIIWNINAYFLRGEHLWISEKLSLTYSVRSLLLFYDNTQDAHP